MRYIFLDIETTNEHLDFEIDKSELIEIWAVNLQSKETFSSCIKVNYPLSEFTKRLTGIQDKDIQWGGNVSDVIKDFINFLWNPEDLVIIWHNIEGFDIPVLSRYSNFFSEVKYLDTLQLFQLFFPWLKEYSVNFLYKYFFDNNEYEEEHRALQDSLDESELFQKCINQEFIQEYWENNDKNIDFFNLLRTANKESIKENTHKELQSIKNRNNQTLWSDFIENNYIYEYINWLFKPQDQNNLKEYFHWEKLKKWVVYSNFFKKFDYEKYKGKKYNYNDGIDETSDEEIIEVYKNCLWEKTPREWQATIIKNINNIINQKEEGNYTSELQKIYWIEAGTGIGKTYGYMIPTMNFLQKNPEHKIFLSTYTKVLQEQIMKEDIHNLWKKFSEVKYCHLKANWEWFNLNTIPFTWTKISLYHIMMLIWIQRWNYYTSDLHYGIISKIANLENYIYNSFALSPTKEDFNKNYWFKWYLQQQLAKNNLFVVNHNFLLSQFWWIGIESITGYFNAIEKEIPFKYYVFLDEGHNIEHVMRETFTLQYDINTFKNIIDFLLPWGNISKTISSLTKEEVKNIGKIIQDESGQINLSQDEQEEMLKKLKIKIENYLKLVDQLQGNIAEKDLDDYIKASIWDFQTSDLYRLAQIQIRELREKYTMDEVLFEKKEILKEYFLSWSAETPFKKTLNKLHKIFQNMYRGHDKILKELANIVREYNMKDVEKRISSSTIKNTILNIWKYLNTWKEFLENAKEGEFFIEGYVQFNEWLETINNFWFKMITKDISKYNQVFTQSKWTCLLSATLSDNQWNKSYILNEISWWKYKQFTPLRSPFNYKENRKIIIEDINMESDYNISFQEKANIVSWYIKRYQGKTLILTTNNKDKDKIANKLYLEFNKQWIMIKKHEWGTINSKANRQNIQSLIDNPNTILVWSKSYMEGVDIPWKNLSFVVLWKLPFLPPRPFIEYQNNKPEYRKINIKYVYKFLCWISFRQAIWRLIRTTTDTWEILILDPRIKGESWSFFKTYIEERN